MQSMTKDKAREIEKTGLGHREKEKAKLNRTEESGVFFGIATYYNKLEQNNERKSIHFVGCTNIALLRKNECKRRLGELLWL